MASDWKIIHSELLFQNRWMELHEDKVEVRPGKITHYTWYRTPDVAVIVPFIDKNALVRIRQYRHPLRKVLLEFPAGHMENNEDPKETATRELLEEVYTYSPSVNISKQLIHIFRGRNLVKGEYEQIVIVSRKLETSKLYRLRN